MAEKTRFLVAIAKLAHTFKMIKMTSYYAKSLRTPTCHLKSLRNATGYKHRPHQDGVLMHILTWSRCAEDDLPRLFCVIDVIFFFHFGGLVLLLKKKTRRIEHGRTGATRGPRGAVVSFRSEVRSASHDGQRQPTTSLHRQAHWQSQSQALVWPIQ